MKVKRIMLVLGAPIITALVVLSAGAEEGDSLWSQTYGGSDSDAAHSITPSGDGGFLLAGVTYSFGAGDGDMWLVKVDADGDSLWSRTYGGSNGDWANSIIPSGDGGFLLAGVTYSFGAGSYDMWLVKVDADGDSLWSRTYGGSDYDVASSIIPSGDGGFLLAGQTYSYGAGDADMWLVKVDAGGDLLWSHTYGGSGGSSCLSIIPSGDGGFLLAGETSSFGAGWDMWLVKVNAQGDSLWSHTYDGGSDWEEAYSIIPSGDGGFLLAGATGSFWTGQDMWLVKVNAQGDSLWSRTYGGSDLDGARAIIPSSDGGFLLAGWTFSIESGGDADIWLVKVDTDFDSLWSQTYGGSGSDDAYSIIPAGDGGFLLTGSTYSFGSGDEDMWLVKVEGPPVAVEPQSETLPFSFNLEAHPNPFNPSTVASFELRVASHVSLQVYDTVGRLVVTLVDGWRAAGTHQATFDGSGLPSGIYLAKLTAGDWSAVQKMVLIR